MRLRPNMQAVEPAVTELELAFAAVEDGIEDVREGRFVIVVDTAAEHGWGGLTLAADQATPEAVNFMLKEARGPLYLCLDHERCDALGLPLIGHSSLRSSAAFMISLE